ncbi:Adenosine (5')-pentaphospho-(5'')-adenosine pyrophosphohydrolase [hydrothermal vent metagenome]|uniref:Adenosine (5')-pentaphospho-(5'')-adenosine pyrophosphohydrolase n=1 Tax=hydrothermal vent metagenome TaxID=652676 RepID=A0A1W1DXX4_9ZZZZ|nr:RNA pyrophosphohydrolase [Gammaproteobacteria bacterium]
MTDKEGYRANVGIVITNASNQILLAKRYQQVGWQLPQGGIDKGENELEALFRELEEEVGLTSEHVEVIAKTPKWLRYDLPDNKKNKFFIGQKQVWFLLKLTGAESNIKLDTHTKIEFEDWKWVDYWYPIEAIIDFKKPVYEDMLKALAPVVFDNQHKIPAQYSRPLKCMAITLNKQ